MSYLNLNVSNLNLNLDLSDVGTGTSGRLAEVFSSFVSNNGSNPHEILNIFILKRDYGEDIPSNLEARIKRSLELPLNKFPFSDHPKRRIQMYLQSLKSYLRDSRFVSFFDGFEKLEDTVVYPLRNACLVRFCNPLRSALFLENGSFSDNVEAIREAVYLLLSLALPSINNVMLHGVGIKRHGMGYLFLGDSGAGKSTIAHYSPPGSIVSDDGIIIEQKKTGYSLRTSPLNQSSAILSSLNGNEFSDISLRKGFFIIKDRTDYTEEVSAPEACSIILKNHIHYLRYFPIDSVLRSVSIVSNLCRQIPFFMLHFRKDSSFWYIIDGDDLRPPKKKLMFSGYQ